MKTSFGNSLSLRMTLLHQPDEFFLHLQRRLQQPLPGADAQNHEVK
ncbi:MAG: hypothetical protein IM638_03095 [Bacteroidetes bacterium]|nr:hypothetical protein [Bacteroidota bacterium]